MRTIDELPRPNLYSNLEIFRREVNELIFREDGEYKSMIQNYNLLFQWMLDSLVKSNALVEYFYEQT